MKKTVFALALAALMLSSSGCKLARSNGEGVLPDVQEYSRAQQLRAAAELKKYGPFIPEVGGMMGDYGVMRDQTKAAKKILSK